jgi:hypothetical protein
MNSVEHANAIRMQVEAAFGDVPMPPREAPPGGGPPGGGGYPACCAWRSGRGVHLDLEDPEILGQCKRRLRKDVWCPAGESLYSCCANHGLTLPAPPWPDLWFGDPANSHIGPCVTD